MPAARLTMTIVLVLIGNPLGNVRTEPQPLIALTIVDRADTSAETISQAEHIVAGIFASAGLSLRWRFGVDAADAGAIPVILLPAATARRMAEFQPAPVLAFAGPPSLRRVWIYGARVRQSAMLYRASEGALLGHVIAHETFHTLGLGHTPDGLMRSSPRSSDGALDRWMSSAEIARIHEALTADARARDARREASIARSGQQR